MNDRGEILKEEDVGSKEKDKGAKKKYSVRLYFSKDRISSVSQYLRTESDKIGINQTN